MLSPIAAPGGSGTRARRGGARAHILALVAIVSVVGLIDSEILAVGVPGIEAGFDLLHLPAAVVYAAIGLLLLWLSAALARQIWRVEHALDAARRQYVSARSGFETILPMPPQISGMWP